MKDMSEWRDAMRDRCKEVLLSHGYTVVDGDVRLYREYNGDKFALGRADLVVVKGSRIWMVVMIEGDASPKNILGAISVVDMADRCLIRTGQEGKMVPLERAVLFVLTHTTAEEYVKQEAMVMMLRDVYTLTNLCDFIVTNEENFVEELHEMELYMA